MSLSSKITGPKPVIYLHADTGSDNSICFAGFISYFNYYCTLQFEVSNEIDLFIASKRDFFSIFVEPFGAKACATPKCQK